MQAKLKGSKHYYARQVPIDITFAGKLLTEDEREKILLLLRDKGLNISIKNNADNIKTITKEQISKKDNIFTNLTNLQSDKDGLFYMGNLKNGQTITARTSIVILGNIEQGASVISSGNVIVIGEINGYVKAGYKGNQDAFVYNSKLGGIVNE